MLCAGLSHKVAVDRSSSVEQLEDIVIQQYPRVSLRAGFTFARADKGRRLQHFTGASVAELESFVGKGKLVIVPRRDLVVPSPAEHNVVSTLSRSVVYYFVFCYFSICTSFTIFGMHFHTRL